MTPNEYITDVFVNCPFDPQYKPLFEALVFRYQQFISDISGQDIQVHGNNEKEAITVVRNWLRGASGSRTIPGGMEIFRRYQLFAQELPALCDKVRLQRNELTFNDLASMTYDWLTGNS